MSHIKDERGEGTYRRESEYLKGEDAYTAKTRKDITEILPQCTDALTTVFRNLDFN